MWVAYVDHFGWQGRDRQGRQKLLIPTTDESHNIGGVCRSFWMAGQVRHSEKRDRQGRQKVLIPTTDKSRNVGGGGGSCWMAG